MSDAENKSAFNYRMPKLAPPQSTDTFVGSVTAYIALVLPLLKFIPVYSVFVAPIVLQHTPTFASFEKAHLVSSSQVASFEMLIFVYLIVRAAYFPFLRARAFAKYSEGLLPVEFHKMWPRQVSVMLRVGIALIAVSLTWGWLAEPLRLAPSRFVFGTLSVLGIGLVFLTEGILDLGLYISFRSRLLIERSTSS
jgi:hypothetical protein